MTILQKRNHKRIGALAIGFAGLLATSVAVAGPGDGKHGDDRYGGDYGDKHDDDDGYDKDDDDDGYGGHGKGKKQKEPRFEDEGDSLRARLEVTGLRRDRDVRVEFEGEARVEIECKRKGKGKGKGQTKRVWLDLEEVEHISKHRIKGDRLYIDIETEDARDVLDDYGRDYGCSGKSWDRKIKQVRFHSARLTVKQNKRTVVDWICDFDPPTRDGDISRKDTKCYRVD